MREGLTCVNHFMNFMQSILHTSFNEYHLHRHRHRHKHTTLFPPKFTELIVLLVGMAIKNFWLNCNVHWDGTTCCSIVKHNLKGTMECRKRIRTRKRHAKTLNIHNTLKRPTSPHCILTKMILTLTSKITQEMYETSKCWSMKKLVNLK